MYSDKISDSGNNRKKSRVVVYPAPDGGALQRDYILRVRPEGEEQWQEVEIYQVKVDMHDVRLASMAFFDFCGRVEVEITFPRFYTVYCADIRPLGLGIIPVTEPKRVSFYLDKAADLSIEINKERFHNLHLFAGAITEAPDKYGENVFLIKGSLEKPGHISDGINREIASLPEGRLVYIEAGIYYIGEFIWHLPSHTKIYLEGGAILKGALVCDKAENVHIYGRGMLYQADFERFSSVNGLRISHSYNIVVENLMFINPPHYTVHLGESENITIRHIKSFSCEGWSDGIDMMSCKNVTVEGGFLRTSDDCIAIYGSRWDNRGGSRNILVKDITLWADVAHPLMIGTHGDYEKGGDTIENITFQNIDILEHHEYQPEYLGAMTINAGDGNTVRNVIYRDIRIEPFEHGKVMDIQVKWNRDYNPIPGHLISGIVMERIFVRTGQGEEPSSISGYDEKHVVENVEIREFYRDGKRVESLEEANICVGKFTKDVRICGGR